MTWFLKKTFDALASFALSITLLSFLMLMTVLGTLEQTHSSLFEVQSRYFESAFVIHHVARHFDGVADVRDELGVLIRREPAGQFVDLAVGRQEGHRFPQFGAAERAILGIAMGHLVVRAGVRLVHLVTGLVDDLSLHRFGLGEGGCAEGEHERDGSNPCEQLAHYELLSRNERGSTRAYT